MKASDAKSPKFDSKWWNQNKAKAADADGGVAKALDVYAAQKQKFSRAIDNKRVAADDILTMQKAIDAVRKQVTLKQKDPKLGALQKETKEALTNYLKHADIAFTSLGGITKNPTVAMKSVALIKGKVPAYRAWAINQHVVENYDFIAFMLDGGKPKDEAAFKKYVKPGAPAEINVNSTILNGFKRVVDGINAGTFPNTTDTWAKEGPWGDAGKAIISLLDTNTAQTWAVFQQAELAKTVTLP